MANSAAETIIGAGVLAATLGFLAYGAAAVGDRGTAAGYELRASFRSAEGIRLGTDVRLAGVKVGSVTAMELDPVTFRAMTSFRVRNGLELPDDTSVVIASEGLLGGNFVELVPGGSEFTLAPGDEVTSTQGAVSLISLLARFVTGSNE